MLKIDTFKMGSNVLLVLTLLPLLGAFFVFLTPEERNTYGVAVWFTFVHLVLAGVTWWGFDPSHGHYQYVVKYHWFAELALHLGVDSISVLFIPLTSLLVFLCVNASSSSYSRYYWIFILLSEAALIGTFCSINLITFYIFFETVLIPVFFLISLWGGQNRRYACMKFFIYTLAGSVFMLIGLVTLIQKTGIDNFETLFAMKKNLPFDVQNFLWWLFMMAFAVKIPMLPFHTWLPHAHVEAPMASSALLAGIMLKMGGYGLLRLVLPLTPDICALNAPYIMWASVAAIIYASLVAYAQTDIKRLIAYSSIAHMGYVTLGLFTLSPLGLSAAIFQMISHGIISAGLFFVIGFLYERGHSRDMKDYRGLAQTMPALSLAMLILTMGSIALPGTIGFWGEFITLVAAYKINPFISGTAALGMILGAIYMLRLYRICFWGAAPSPSPNWSPLRIQEKITLFILCACVLIYGVHTKRLTQTIQHAKQHAFCHHYAR